MARCIVEEIVGKRFGLLVVLKRVSAVGAREVMYLCQCDCGKTHISARTFLRRGDTKSCGCARWKAKHGHNRMGGRSATYQTWHGMLQRCTNPNVSRYRRYGGRGIAVCDRWRIFGNFLEDMGERPHGKTLDRIDNDGNYEPMNCRWATPKEQSANTVHWRHMHR